MKEKKYVFLSYSRVDSKFAMRVTDDLKKHGFNIWVDQSNIPGGKHWDNDIEEALKNSYVVVLLVSPSSVVSENVKDEISFARNKNIHIIPIVYQETEIPLRWHRLQFIDIYKDYKLGLKNLIECISNESNKKTMPKVEKSKTTKILVYIIIVLFLIVAIILFFNKTDNNSQNIPQEVPKSTNNSTYLYKGNTVVIGHGNKDINITQE